MQHITYHTPNMAPTLPHIPYPVPTGTREASRRAVEGEGLSQAELRRIVIDIIG